MHFECGIAACGGIASDNHFIVVHESAGLSDAKVMHNNRSSSRNSLSSNRYADHDHLLLAHLDNIFLLENEAQWGMRA